MIDGICSCLVDLFGVWFITILFSLDFDLGLVIWFDFLWISGLLSWTFGSTVLFELSMGCIALGSVGCFLGICVL